MGTEGAARIVRAAVAAYNAGAKEARAIMWPLIDDVIAAIDQAKSAGITVDVNMPLHGPNDRKPGNLKVEMSRVEKL